nr:MAG TPA: hypothetical protein [Caudoviricetes sp.]
MGLFFSQREEMRQWRFASGGVSSDRNRCKYTQQINTSRHKLPHLATLVEK